MHLTLREEERIQIWAAAEMARRRVEKGVRLNYPEAVAADLRRNTRTSPRRRQSRC